MIGVAVGHREVVLRKLDPSWLDMLDEKTQWLDTAGLPMNSEQMKKIAEDSIYPVAFKFMGAFFLSVIISVIIRLIWLQIEKRQSNISVSFSSGEKNKPIIFFNRIEHNGVVACPTRYVITDATVRDMNK